MNAQQAKRLVLLALPVVGIAATLRHLREQGRPPSVTVPIGTFAAAVMLAIVAEVAPGLAGAFAMLALVTAALLSVELWRGIRAATTN